MRKIGLVATLASALMLIAGPGCGGGSHQGTDGGTTPTDGGTTPTDGGTTPTDGGTTPTDGGTTPVQTQVTATIGFTGGSLTLDGATVTFPLGALAGDTQVTLTHTLAAAPSGYQGDGRVWRLSDTGMALSRPVEVVLPFTGSDPSAGVFWTRPGGSQYDHIGATITGTQATFRIVSLGSGFVASTQGYTNLTFYALSGTYRAQLGGGGAAEGDDLSHATVAVYLPNGSGTGTGLNTYPGTGTGTGLARIPAVPPATRYLVQVGSRVFWTTQTTLDFTRSGEGRYGQVTGTNGTSLTVHVTGMSAWQTGQDALYLFVPNLGSNWALGGPYLIGTFSTTPTGTTGDATFDFSYSSLVDATKGDVVYVAQARTATDSNGVSRATILELGKATNLTIINGTTTSSLTVGLAPVSQTQSKSITVSVDQTGFNAAYAALPTLSGTVTPYAGLGWLVNVYADPAGPKVGSGIAPLLFMKFAAGTGTMDIGPVSFPDMFPTWSQEAFVSRFEEDRVTPASGTAYAVPYIVGEDASPSTVSAGPVTLELGFVGNVKVDGQAATKVLTGVTTTPTISWDAPTTGTASLYEVDVEGATGFAILATTQTQIQVPPGILQAGTQYRLRIDAYSGSGIDPAAPFHRYDAAPKALSVMGIPPIEP